MVLLLLRNVKVTAHYSKLITMGNDERLSSFGGTADSCCHFLGGTEVEEVGRFCSHTEIRADSVTETVYT